MIAPTLYGTAANRPSASTLRNGQTYVCTDSPAVYIAQAGAWKMQAYGEPMVTPASAGSYTTRFANSALPLLLTNVGDAIDATQTDTSQSNFAVALVAQTFASTWRVTLKCTAMMEWGVQYPEYGVVVADGTTAGTSNGYCMGVFNNTYLYNYENFSAKVGAASISVLTQRTVNGTIVIPSGAITHLSICSDGTQIFYQTSTDGKRWVLWENGRALPSSIGQYGFHLGNCHGSASGARGRLNIFENAYTGSLSTASVTGATGNTVTPIKLTFGSAHPFLDGDMVSVSGMVGNTGGNNNTSCIYVQNVDSTHINLIGTTGNGTWTSGGTVTLISR